ncbi:4-alpha-glucanotransferase [Desulfovibrio sp. OttesenSCG-928-C06]|nr:4-alpha-glucanotransferase [Desulfovibrio sp. OttesenSCG-928-C06]
MPENRLTRACGILLHISSLPSKYGIGDLGPDAHAFAETLAAAGLEYWQFLPLTPTSPFIGNSPYSSPSAFAGNPLLISPEFLLEDGFITNAELEASLDVILPQEQAVEVDAANGTQAGAKTVLEARSGAPATAAQTVRNAVCSNNGSVDFEAVGAQRLFLLNAAFGLLRDQGITLAALPGYKDFVAENAYWLDDYAMFAALKEAHNGASWTEWPKALKQREASVLENWISAHRYLIERQTFIQYLFNRQWNRLHERCRTLGVKLVGDMPIYVTHDSADVWARPELYRLDQSGTPLVVAGVPPDYFSETGQRWGNPVYDWHAMRTENFLWWIKRMEHNLRQSDIVRLDHFRGFCAYWEIPAEEETAVRGRWVEAPGRELMAAMRQHFGNLPIIAEDLGVITPDVRELMGDFDLPGMKVLQFGFGGQPGTAPDAPFRHPEHSVVYTGTHDNPPTRQWFAEAEEQEKNNFICYRGQDMDTELANEVLMRMALESHSRIAILPMQDVLRLGAESRMNTPSQAKGNWRWRLCDKHGWLNHEHWVGSCAGIWSQPLSICHADGRTAAADGNHTASQQESPLPGQSPEKPVSMDGEGIALSAAIQADKRPGGSAFHTRKAVCAAPVPDVFGHVHFLCGLYGRLEGKSD